MRGSLLTVLFAGLVMMAQPALADGLDAPNPSVRALASAGASDVASEGIDAAWSNPAALASLYERQFFVSLDWDGADATGVDAGSFITRPASTPAAVGGQVRTDGAAPQFNLSAGLGWRVSRRLLAGLSLAAPYGQEVEAPAGTWSRYQATAFDFSGANLRASLAWLARRDLTLAIGVDIAYSRVRYDLALPNLAAGSADGTLSYEATGLDAGWVLGARWSPLRRLTVGASYSSGLNRGVSGGLRVSGLTGPVAGLNGEGTAAANIATPWVGAVGFAWRAGASLTISGEIRRSGWSRFQGLRFASPAPVAGALATGRDTTSYAFGAAYEVAPLVVLRAGYRFDPAALTPTALFPGGSRRTYAAGLSFPIDRTAEVDLAVSWSEISGTSAESDIEVYSGAQATSVSLRGAWRSSRPVVAVALRRRM